MNQSDPAFVKAVEQYVSDKGGFAFYADRIDPAASFIDADRNIVLKRKGTGEILARYWIGDDEDQAFESENDSGFAPKSSFQQIIQSEVGNELYRLECSERRYILSATAQHLRIEDGKSSQSCVLQWGDLLGFKPIWVNKKCLSINIKPSASYPFWVGSAAILLSDVGSCAEACQCLDEIRRRLVAEQAIAEQRRLVTNDQSYLTTIVNAEGLGLPSGVAANAVFGQSSLQISLCDTSLTVEIQTQEIIKIEVSGPGTVTTNAGMVGGGFGLEGAAWGIAAASIINALTTSSTTNTLVTVATRTSSITLHTNQYDTEDLRIRLSSHIAAAESRAVLPPSPPAVDIASKLKELADLKDLGMLTDDEFAIAKAKLLNS